MLSSRWAWRSALAFTPERLRSEKQTSLGSASTSRRVSLPRPHLVRCGSRLQSRCSLPDQDSSSMTEANTTSKAFRGHGGCSRFEADRMKSLSSASR